jgi:hypothetical protein
MALSDKNIVITPNVGQSADPQIVFSGADASSGPNNIVVKIYPTDSGTLSFEGSSGQLFSITNSLSGTIFSVNDISGIPSIEVLDTGLVKLAEYGGNVLVGTGTDNGYDKLQVNGSTNVKGISSTPKIITATTATTVLDLLEADHFHVTLQTNTTFSISNAASKIGSNGNIIIIQDGTGGRTFTKPAEMKTPIGGATIDQTTLANSVSILSYYVVSSSVILVNYIGNFA